MHRLSASLIVADHLTTLITNGAGELVEPEGFVAGAGSGGDYAVAGARSILAMQPGADAEQVCEAAIRVAADMDIYTSKLLFA